MNINQHSVNTENSVNTGNSVEYKESIKSRELLDSLGEELGTFKAYDSQLTIPEIVGTRIVKCLYKTSAKTGESKAQNSYVRIPTKHISEEKIISSINELSPYVVTWLQELEDKGIKENHSKGMLTVHTNLLSLDLLIEKLEESEAGARLSKDKIGAWFTEYLQDKLALLFAAKMNLDDSASEEELTKLEVILVAYKTKFESLAGGKTFIKKEECIAMIGVIEKCEAETSLLGSRFIARLTKMSKQENEVLLSL